MKKILIIFSLFLIIKADSVTNQYLEYTNKLVNYNLLLRNFDKIHSPFEKDYIIVKKKVKAKKLVKIIHINLLSVFNKKAYVLIQVYLGNQLIKSYKKWLKIGDKIDTCKLTKVEFSKIIFKCKNKKLIKTLNVKNLNIKEKRW